MKRHLESLTRLQVAKADTSDLPLATKLVLPMGILAALIPFLQVKEEPDEA